MIDNAQPNTLESHKHWNLCVKTSAQGVSSSRFSYVPESHIVEGLTIANLGKIHTVKTRSKCPTRLLLMPCAETEAEDLLFPTLLLFLAIRGANRKSETPLWKSNRTLWYQIGDQWASTAGSSISMTSGWRADHFPKWSIIGLQFLSECNVICQIDYIVTKSV